jgi:hypothetical protein
MVGDVQGRTAVYGSEMSAVLTGRLGSAMRQLDDLNAIIGAWVDVTSPLVVIMKPKGIRGRMAGAR